jgi:trans-aconitate 2-methyltransferase
MRWSPDQYLRFADHRLRPGLELLARIPDIDPGVVFDLGCGTGNLTREIGMRWPEARVVGVDSSVEMISKAEAEFPDIEFEVGDIETWTPEHEVDLIFSNATLHWLDHHGRLFPRLFDFLRPGGLLAVQMPNNWSAPTHTVPKDVLADARWTEEVRHLLPIDRVDEPGEYRRWLIDAASSFDIWQTTYYQELTGDDPVWEWTTGSLLRPVLAALEAGDLADFTAAVKGGYRNAYPPDHTGTVLLPFRRLFLIAVRKMLE